MMCWLEGEDPKFKPWGREIYRSNGSDSSWKHSAKLVGRHRFRRMYFWPMLQDSAEGGWLWDDSVADDSQQFWLQYRHYPFLVQYLTLYVPLAGYYCDYSLQLSLNDLEFVDYCRDSLCAQIGSFLGLIVCLLIINGNNPSTSYYYELSPKMRTCISSQ